MVRRRLAVVIPCHNEAATLGPVVAGACRFADVLVVDDRSTDASREVARANGATVVASAKPGYDGAIETGLACAFDEGYAFVVTLDADGEHDPACVEAFDLAFNGGADLVCGVRAKPQRAAEYVVAAVGRRLFQIDDLLCGMKGYSHPVLQRYFDSGLSLAINMAPAVLWRRDGGAHAQVAVTGRVRTDAPRFGRALRANWRILRAFQALLVQTRSRAAPVLGTDP
jgi:glycosyltransferase involved in cell wall biosynthesis